MVCLSSVRHGCIVAKRCEIGPRLLLITNRKSHINFQMTRKSLTLDDLQGQYYNRNCIDCSTSFLAIAGFLVYLYTLLLFLNQTFTENTIKNFEEHFWSHKKRTRLIGLLA